MHKTPPLAAVEGLYTSRPCPSSTVRCGTDRSPLLSRQIMRCSDGHFPGLERTNAFSYQIQSYLLHMQYESRPEHAVSQHRGALPRTCTRLVVGPLAACGVRRLSGEGQVMRAIHMKDQAFNSVQGLRMLTWAGNTPCSQASPSVAFASAGSLSAKDFERSQRSTLLLITFRLKEPNEVNRFIMATHNPHSSGAK